METEWGTVADARLYRAADNGEAVVRAGFAAIYGTAEEMGKLGDRIGDRWVSPRVQAVTDLADRFDNIQPGETGFAAFTCGEANALARVMGLFGHTGTAANVLSGHAEDCDGMGDHEMLNDALTAANIGAQPGESIDQTPVDEAAALIVRSLVTGEPVEHPKLPPAWVARPISDDLAEWLRDHGKPYAVGGDSDWRNAASVYLFDGPVKAAGGLICPGEAYVREVEGKHERAWRVLDAHTAIRYVRQVEREYLAWQDERDADA